MAVTRGRSSRPITRGDVVLVPFPFTDLSASKLRPAIVLWVDSSFADLTLAFVTSRQIVPVASTEVAVMPTHPEYALTGLGVPSKIRAARIATVSRSILRRWLGRLGPLLLADVDRALIVGLGINPVPYREEGRREERSRLVALQRAGGAASLLADLGLPASVGGPDG